MRVMPKRQKKDEKKRQNKTTTKNKKEKRQKNIQQKDKKKKKEKSQRPKKMSLMLGCQGNFALLRCLFTQGPFFIALPGSTVSLGLVCLHPLSFLCIHF